MADLRTPSKPISRAWPFKRTFYGWAVVLAAFSASFGEVPAFGPILGIFMKPMEDELGWSRATIAAGFTIGSLVGALASMVVGRLADRFGARFVVDVAGVLISSSMLAISQIHDQPEGLRPARFCQRPVHLSARSPLGPLLAAITFRLSVRAQAVVLRLTSQVHE